MKWNQGLGYIGLGLITLLLSVIWATLSHSQSNVSSVNVLRQGEEISINGNKLPISWRQWEGDGRTYLGVSDTAAQQRLGVELLSSNDPQVQPVWWFGAADRLPYQLKTLHLQGNRYLDLTPILRQTIEELAVFQNRLEISTLRSQVQDIRRGKPSWGERIVIDLDQPSLWQVKQGREEATVTLAASTPARIREQFPPQAETEEELEAIPPPLLVVRGNDRETELKINLPDNLKLRVSTLADPMRLVIDLRPDNLKSKIIHWTEGVKWRQDYLPWEESSVLHSETTEPGSERPPRSLFAVTWLEIDPQLAKVDLTPIWSNLGEMKGIASLTDMGKQSQVEIAINGGFFNRNTKLPLGAIKREGEWFSSPILNRGAIAWDNQGNLTMDRLRYQETLITDTGEKVSLQALNSGYVQSVIARYTPAWGAAYTPLTDEEMVVVVKNQRVNQLVTGYFDQQQRIPIPRSGYLLTIRGKPDLVGMFRKGTSLQIAPPLTSPPDGENERGGLASYPHILGAGPLLIKNRQVVLDGEAENFSQAFINQKAHRSAIALTGNGKILLVAMGEGVNRAGPTLEEAAGILQGLGAQQALNLDGGSSTSLYLGGEIINRPPATAAPVHNGIGIYTRD